MHVIMKKAMVIAADTKLAFKRGTRGTAEIRGCQDFAVP